MKTLFSYFIFLFISILVVGGAGLTINLSLTSNSNLTYINHAYRQIAANFNNPRRGVVAGIQQAAAAENCYPLPSPVRNFNDDQSLVNYLYNRNIDYSFDNRRQLAIILNIDNYSGSSQENSTLLNRLKESNSLCTN
jgi:hypothetical protein